MLHRVVSASVVRVLLLALCVFFVACASEGEAPRADEVEAELFPSTRVLTTDDMSALERETDEGALTFSKAPAALDGVAAGDVFLAPATPKTPNGMLRVVLEATREGEALTLQTAGAPAQLAFRKLAVRVARPVELDAQPTADRAGLAPLGIGGDVERGKEIKVVVFDGDGDPSTTDDQVRIEGRLGGGFSYDLSFGFDWGGIFDLPNAVRACLASLPGVLVGKTPKCSVESLIPEAKIVFEVDPRMAAQVRVIGKAALAFEKDFDVATIHLPPIVLGPVIFTPAVEIIARVEGGASASFRAGVDGRLEMQTSVTASTKTAGKPVFATPSIKDWTFSADTPEVGLHAHAKASVGVRLEMPLYAVAGPYASAAVTASIEADPLKTPCWQLSTGVESRIGVKLTTPKLPFVGSVTVADAEAAPFKVIDKVIASGQCSDPPPGATHLPPGSGPDAKALREPAFTPWSRLVEGDVAPSAGIGPFATGLVFSQLSKSVDDRWLVAGSEARSLLKIDADGNKTWQVRYLDPTGQPLKVLRTAPTRDAAIAVLASGTEGSAFDLLKVGQGGGLAFARGYALPFEACATPRADLLVHDATDGFSVLGTCLSQDRAFVVHLTRAGDVRAAEVWTAAGATSIAPRAWTVIGDELVLTGEIRGGTDGMFVARLSRDGAIGEAKRYTACAAAMNLTPTAIGPAEQGGLTILGGSFAQRRGLIARVERGGAVRFAKFPGEKAGAAPVFVPSAIAELPTSGFVMAASTFELLGDGVTQVPAVALAGVDTGGRVTWSKRYALRGPAGIRATSFGALRLTADGGAQISAIANATDGAAAATWNLKVPAKDGAIVDPQVTASPMALDDGPTCAIDDAPLAFAQNAVEVETATRAVSVERR